MPTFAIHVDRLGGERRPHYITVRQLQSIDEVEQGDEFLEIVNYVSNIAVVLKTVIENKVSNYVPTTAQVTGYLSGLDENSVEIGSPYRIDSLNDINTELLEAILTQVQSRDELTIETITWQFVIDQNVLITGGSLGVKLPAFASKTVFAKTWKYHGVNCAAFAITHAMNHLKRWPLERTIRNAILLQDELNWGEYVSFDQILKQIPMKFPDYRISILIPNVFNIYNTAQGLQFNHTNLKQVYLVYDCAQKHYGATLHPAQFFRTISKNHDYRVCLECNVLFSVGRGHECDITTLPTSATNKRKRDANFFCKACKETVFFIHNCCETKCRSCPLNYKKVNP